ncbi:plastocyanin/azurin family copper-binding protein [Nitrosopumilus maritimus]|uniref:Protease inhibitor Kazal-type n=1 Tax=Nitrosopumilus maritimus (strain SCM1) TaxID=436308 RepID=A9A1G7_NITMS|nr:Kazal-type serine protease inhibitor domain-containing protein [Nitrosopumilus maritimus]ABX13146.1 protease inhibitor Kazal-type [Nitrosopumilus maritimus SCM1]
MNFSYGIIAAVGILVAISVGLISMSPDEIIEPRTVEEQPIACTMQWDPMCGVDGETYGNSCMLDAANVKLDYVGECVIAEPEPEPIPEPEPEPEPIPEPEPEPEPIPEPEPEPEPIPEPEPEPEPIPEPEPEPETQSDLPMSLTISAPEGSGVPGCEETNECYLPYEATVAVGTTVTWSNDDTAAHTVTSGNVSAGPTGVFDSGLFMSGGTFEFTFEETGTYDYFCMVHPWMTGIIHVE